MERVQCVAPSGEGTSARCPWKGRLTGPHNQFGRSPAGKRTPVVPAQSLVPVPTELYRPLARYLTLCPHNLQPKVAAVNLPGPSCQGGVFFLRRTVQCKVATECPTAVTVHLYTLTVSVMRGWGMGVVGQEGGFPF